MNRLSPVISFCVGAVALLNACTAASSPGISSGSSDSSGGLLSSAPSRSGGPATGVVADLDAPWSIAFADSAILISERSTARILEVTGETTREVGIIAQARPGGEGGVLGLATRGGFLYAYITGAEDNRVVRLPLLGVPGALSLGSAEVIIDAIPKANFHNGGRIAFGPDGMLYVTTGDVSQPGVAQNVDSLAGKILRLTSEGNIPADNPFPGNPVYSLGHRNPQGIGWDAGGTMYSTEFGQNTWDELNVIEAGANYGWPAVEGIAGVEGYRDPVQQWDPAVASPSGLTVTEGSIFIANLRGERLREVPLHDLGTAIDHFPGGYGRLRDVVSAPDGSLLFLSNNTDGRGSPEHGDDRLFRWVPGPPR